MPSDLTSATGLALRLRPCRSADREFLQTLYDSTRAAELALAPWAEAQKAAFLRQQLTARETHYAGQHPHASNDIVLLDDRDAGRLMVDRSAAELLVVDIALLPEHRGAGIGTALLRQVLAEATDTGRPVRLHADPNGAARRLYLRLGFISVNSDGVHELMERLP